jgi:hypothetical protein
MGGGTNTGSIGQFAQAARNSPRAIDSGSTKGFQKLPIFNEIEAPAYSQFTAGLGGLASKFSGMGGTGARKSSGFQNAGNQALSEFSQGLASQRQSLSSQALKDLFSMSNMLLSQRPFEYREEKQEPDWFTKLLGYGGDIASIFSQFVPGGGAGGGASRQQQYQGF